MVVLMVDWKVGLWDSTMACSKGVLMAGKLDELTVDWTDPSLVDWMELRMVALLVDM